MLLHWNITLIHITDKSKLIVNYFQRLSTLLYIHYLFTIYCLNMMAIIILNHYNMTAEHVALLTHTNTGFIFAFICVTKWNKRNSLTNADIALTIEIGLRRALSNNSALSSKCNAASRHGFSNCVQRVREFWKHWAIFNKVNHKKLKKKSPNSTKTIR